MIVLVVVILLTGIPILMGMGAVACPQCSPGVLAGGCVPAVLAVAALLIALTLAMRFNGGHRRLRSRLFAALLDPPPRLV